MRAVLVGGTGFLGTRLAHTLERAGWDLTVFGLTPPREGAPGRFVRGDRTEARDLRALVRRGDVDVVVDLVAYRPADTETMVAAWTGRAARFVHLSTLAVYRRLLEPVAGEDQAERWAPSARGYGADKAACERVLEATEGLPATILRSAPVMGPDDPVSRENYVVRRIRSGRPLLHPGSAAGHISLVYVDDLVDALERGTRRTAPGVRAYNLAQPEPLTLDEHVGAIAGALGHDPVPVREVALTAMRARGLRVCGYPFALPGPHRFAVDRARDELGVAFTPYPQAVRRTVLGGSWHGDRAVWPGRGSMQSRLCGTHPWLHEEAEEAWLAGVALPRRSSDDALGWLTATGGEHEAPLVMGAEAAARHRDVRAGPSGAGRPVLVVPDARLSSLAATAGTARDAGPEDGGLLCAAIEPASHDPRAGWLYSTAAPGGVLSYGGRVRVPLVRFTGFAVARLDAVPPDERVVVDLADEADALAFTDWLEACEDRGYLEVPSTVSYSRIFVAHLCRWLPGGPARADLLTAEGRVRPLCRCRDTPSAGALPCARPPSALAAAYDGLRRRAPDAARWASVFTLARLLRGSGADGVDGAVRLLLSTDAHPLIAGAPPGDGGGMFRLAPSMQLFRIDDRCYVADTARSRLLHLPPPVLAVAEAARRSPSRHHAHRALRESLATTAAAAEHVYGTGLEQLRRARVLVPADDEVRSVQEVGRS